ncbi:hypothetical protein H4Q26_001253 [Puccinia striiformis f. sp. tritici PST-130]|nr:hypothetical protein H4Q26_001253 [Puccinia striiformis f. sp. tritici PST-130]
MESWHPMWDFQVITEITKNLPPTDPACLRARTFAMNIMNTFQPGDLSTIAACGRIAERLLGSDWTQKEVFDPKSDWNLEGDSEGTPVFAIGHCHIDTAWLWPFSPLQHSSTSGLKNSIHNCSRRLDGKWSMANSSAQTAHGLRMIPTCRPVKLFADNFYTAKDPANLSPVGYSVFFRAEDIVVSFQRFPTLEF